MIFLTHSGVCIHMLREFNADERHCHIHILNRIDKSSQKYKRTNERMNDKCLRTDMNKTKEYKKV